MQEGRPELRSKTTNLLAEAKRIGRHINRNFKYSPKDIGIRKRDEERHQDYCWEDIGRHIGKVR